MAESQMTGVYDVELSRWAELVGQSTQNAVSGLSAMMGIHIRVTALDLKVVPVDNAADMVGGAENEAVVIYLGIVGGATGHIMLVYPLRVAFGLVDMLLGQETGTTCELGELEESALQEMGNITGTFFLNSMGDSTGIVLMPTPPTVMVDMAGAIIYSALSDIMVDRDELFTMETIFATDDREIVGTLLVLPTADFMDVMIKQKEEYSRVQW